MAGRVSRDSRAGEPGWPGGGAGIAGMAGMAGRITRMVSVQWEMEPCIIECAQGGGTKKEALMQKASQTKK